MKKILFPILGLALALALALPVAANGPVEPPTVDGALQPGESCNVTKNVTTPEIPPNPDIYFMADTTGSMGGVIAAVQSNAGAIMTAILANQSTAQFGVGNYRDYPDTVPPFQHQQSITANTSLVSTAIGNWSAGGGGDGPEAQFYALDRLANGTGIDWRGIGTKIVVWFGDAPAHDPVPNAATGLGYDITEATVTADLVAAGIKVIAISVNTSYYSNGTDDDPTDAGGDYAFAYNITEDGTAGQASRIANATGGAYLFAATPAEAVDAVLAGIEELTTDVWWNVTAVDPGINVTLMPAVHYGVSGNTTVAFNETVTVTADPSVSTTYNATVAFYANTYPETEGALIGNETITITVIVIDIKPWSDPNSINTKSKGVVPVAILGSDTFNVTTVNVSTLKFGPDDAMPAHNLTDPDVYNDHLVQPWLVNPLDPPAEWYYYTANEDDYVDLVMHFRQRDTGLSPGDTVACLTGMTDGLTFTACDAVLIRK
jgi:hypothetical protein